MNGSTSRPSPFRQQYTFGNASPFITDADSIVSFDIALQKVFPINEQHRIELRGEFFNMPNTVTGSDRRLQQRERGTHHGPTCGSRQIQFGLRWRF
ncbi:MAG: hypothetical protein R2724_00855 [Bryobacterales bacterium]